MDLRLDPRLFEQPVQALGLESGRDDRSGAGVDDGSDAMGRGQWSVSVTEGLF